MAIKPTITLDEALPSRARCFRPPQAVSQWINSLILERLAELERDEMEALMREGYIANEQQGQDIHKDWQITDQETWPS